MNNFNSEPQLKDTEYAIKNQLEDLLFELRDLNSWQHWLYSFKKKKDVDDVSESIYSSTISNMQTFLGKGSGWIIDSAIDRNITISK